MSEIRTELDRIIAQVEEGHSKATAKGGTPQSSKTLANLLTAIDTIPTGGSPGGLPTGVSMLSSGTFTTPSDVAQLNVTHGLGVKPNFYIWHMMGEDFSEKVGTSMAVFGAGFLTSMKYKDSADTVYPFAYMVRGYNANSQATGSTSTGNANYMTDAECTLVTSASYRFRAGYTYLWICGVMDNGV